MRFLPILCAAVLAGAGCHRSTIGRSIGDRDYWNLVETISEPPGSFTVSDNFVSNEPRVAENVRWLRPSGGVYIGVGPEQNFSYIARLQPAVAFIVDIRRENRNLHLLYKALFEVAGDRAAFLSRLFSRPRPPGVDTGSSVDELFTAYEHVAASRELYTSTVSLVSDRLRTTHGFPLTQEDVDGIARVLDAFYTDGPEIQFWGSRGGTGDGAGPSYRRLMTVPDLTGESRSFLASEEAFRMVRDLQSKNLVVPVVGNFAGAGALARIGDYVRAHNDAVHAFYGSNVGVYLTKAQARAFCGNLARLPAAPDARFIESDGVRPFASKLDGCPRDAR